MRNQKNCNEIHSYDTHHGCEFQFVNNFLIKPLEVKTRISASD